MDMQKVLKTAADHGKMIELNAHPYRLDLDWRYCKLARQMGIMISINPDAHDAEGLDDIIYGVTTARRGWLSKTDILNALPLQEATAKLKRT